METTRNEMETSPNPTKRIRCKLLIAVLCIAVSTLVFFGTVVAIVWLFEHNIAYRYSVVCFMVGSGTLYIVAFTSSLLLLTGELTKKSKSTSNEEQNVEVVIDGAQNEAASETDSGVTDSVQNEVGSVTETASYISYRGGAQQLSQRITPIKTSPPPYKEPPGTSTSQNDTNQVQSTQASNNASFNDNFKNFLFYYELDQKEVQKKTKGRREQKAGFAMEMQTVVKSHSTNGSLNHSKPLTNALKRQLASNSSLLSASSYERSPKPMRNPSQGVKRKLKAAPLSMSHPDLHSVKGKALQTDSNSDTRSLQHNFNPQVTPKIHGSNVEGRTSQSIMNHQEIPKIPRSNVDARTSLSNLNLPGTVKIPRSNAEVQSSLSNLNPSGTPKILRSKPDAQISLSNLNLPGTPRIPRSNAEVQSSQSNLNPQGTPKIPRSKPDGQISQSNFNLQGTPKIQRSNAEVRTSQANLSSEIRQASQSVWNEDTKSSLIASPQFSRSNLLRSSQMHLIPETLLQTSQSSLNVDQKSKLESLSAERTVLDSKPNYLVMDKPFPSYSDLHLNAQRNTSNSYGLKAVPQVLNSSLSLNTESSHMIGEYLKEASKPLKPFQKLFHPQHFVAQSENASKLQKASSFTSLPSSNPLQQVSSRTLPEATSKVHLPDVSSNRQMSGRSIESVLDATRTKQMSPDEWLKAWNQGFKKLPNEAEKIVGVRV